MRFPRSVRIFRGQLDASPFVGVLFLITLFLLLNSSLVFIPGVPIELPESVELPGFAGPAVTAAVDGEGRLYFQSQVITEEELKHRLGEAVRNSRDSLTLVLMADRTVPYATLIRLSSLAREAGIPRTLCPTRPAKSRNETPPAP